MRMLHDWGICSTSELYHCAQFDLHNKNMHCRLNVSQTEYLFIITVGETLIIQENNNKHYY